MKAISILTIFLGSFIAFAVEPMIGRTLLPVFGGTPSVWISCLSAFQLLMVLGYWYAGVVGNTTSRPTRALHLILLLIASAWSLTVAFGKRAILGGLSTCIGIPALDVFVCVLALSALVFVLLAANSTIVQSVSGGDYRLYAVSNVGSLLGLFAYPTLVEPYIALKAQWMLLAGAILVYALSLACMLLKTSLAKTPEAAAASECANAMVPSHGLSVLYFVLPALSAALLNATTSYLTLDIAPIPLLWAILLGLFLVSYIIGFSGWSRPVHWLLPAVVSATLAIVFYFKPHRYDFYSQLICYALALFFVTTFLHAWLYSIRPAAASLSRYYLLNVIGGAVGGLLTSLVAPVVFDSILEFPALLFVSVALTASWTLFAAKRPMKVIAFAALAMTAVLGFFIGESGKGDDRVCVHRSRGFFGTLSVMESFRRNQDGTTNVIHGLNHGSINHGVQVFGGGLERMPTAYYTPFACGHAVLGHPSYKTEKPMRVCLVGMGTGIYLVYARTNDYYRAYEISPEVVDVATNKKLFAFVDTCRVKPDIRVMDARKGLEAEEAANEEKYDVLLLDAFSGDSIPYHLSTKEAIQLYLNRLKPDGLLCVHFSNEYLQLMPYIKGIAQEFNLRILPFHSVDDVQRFGFDSDVAIYLKAESKLAPLPLQSGMCKMYDFRRVPTMEPFPTDEKGSFLRLISLFY